MPTTYRASPNDILLGSDATEDALRAKPLEQYAVIYFATHGLLPGELHCQTEPSLVLSPPNRDAVTAANDGLLSASEIAVFRLNADLVVLLCLQHRGGGAAQVLAAARSMGWPTRFQCGGPGGSGRSNWQVPSAATTQLMTAVFANLARDSKHDVTEALRQAQLSMISRDSTAHPFDWAAFTFIGAGGGQT